MTDTYPLGLSKEVSHGGPEGAVSVRVQGAACGVGEDGRSPAPLAREFEPSEQTIRNWVRRADVDEGFRSDGLTTEARNELDER